MHDSSSNLSPLGASTELVQLSSDMNILESLYWNSFGFDLIKIHLLRVEQFISKKGQNFVCKYTHIFPKRVLHRVENGWGCACSFVKWSHMVKNDMLKLHLYRVPINYRLKVNGSERHKNGANQILFLCMFSPLWDIWFNGI